MDSTEIGKRLKDGDERMSRIESNQERLEGKLDDNTDATGKVLDILNTAKSFFRFAELTGNVIKWVAGVLAPVVALWYATKGGSK